MGSEETSRRQDVFLSVFIFVTFVLLGLFMTVAVGVRTMLDGGFFSVSIGLGFTLLGLGVSIIGLVICKAFFFQEKEFRPFRLFKAGIFLCSLSVVMTISLMTLYFLFFRSWSILWGIVLFPVEFFVLYLFMMMTKVMFFGKEDGGKDDTSSTDTYLEGENQN